MASSIVVGLALGSGSVAAAGEARLGAVHNFNSNGTGCSSKRPTHYPLNSRFYGVRAVARKGVPYSTVFDRFKYDMYPSWCITALVINPRSRPVDIAAVFYSKASNADVRRFATFLVHMGLFSKVSILKKRLYE